MTSKAARYRKQQVERWNLKVMNLLEGMRKTKRCGLIRDPEMECRRITTQDLYSRNQLVSCGRRITVHTPSMVIDAKIFSVPSETGIKLKFIRTDERNRHNYVGYALLPPPTSQKSSTVFAS